MNKLKPHILDKLKTWQQSPLLFVTEAFEWSKGTSPTPQQVEALKAFPKSKRMTIRSGHGCGKSCISAWLALWFMATRPYAKVVVTAPTSRQLHDIFWSELSKWFRKSKLQEEFVQQKDKFFHKDASKEWWIRLVSPQSKASKDEQAETLAGFHADHLLIICDEASGIANPTYIPLEGALTQPDNKVLLIGNMTKNNGYFYDTHFHANISKKWNKIHWDSRKSPIVTKDMVELFKEKYGEESNVFAIRVAGNPPSEDESTLIPLAWARQCLGNEVEVSEDEPLYLGVDVARYGEDVSIILPRQGLRISPWEIHRGLNTIDLGGHINQAYNEMDASGIAIDEIGVGAGVTDWLQKHGHLRCFGINVANKSSNLGKFDRLRDELWLSVREKCMKGLYSFPDTEEGEDLCNELASPVYDFNTHGGFKVESKRVMKTRGVASPNKADALCLTEYFANIAYKVWAKKPARKSYLTSSYAPSSHSWMAV